MDVYIWHHHPDFKLAVAVVVANSAEEAHRYFMQTVNHAGAPVPNGPEDWYEIKFGGYGMPPRMELYTYLNGDALTKGTERAEP